MSEAAAEDIRTSGRGGGDEGIIEEDISDSLFSLPVPVIDNSEFRDSRSLPGRAMNCKTGSTAQLIEVCCC